MTSSPSADSVSASPTPGDWAQRFAPAAVAGILLFSLVLRIVLIWHGGQFFDPDEDRYLVSRAAAARLAEGDWRQALTLPLEGGDHAGYKFIGIAPALVERWLGEDPRIPALFFGGFSVVNLALLWLIARRVSSIAKVMTGWSALSPTRLERLEDKPLHHGVPKLTPRSTQPSSSAALWTLLLAAGSSTLFYPARHILPFDASMALGLAALYAGLRRPGSTARSFFVGFIAALGFSVYYGYWTFAGVVILLHALHAHEDWRKRAEALLAGVSGGSCALMIPLALGELGGGQLATKVRAFSGTIYVGDYRGHITPWEFLHHADGLLVWLTVAAAAVALARWLGARGQRSVSDHPGFLFALGVAAVWFSFMLTANVLHKFVIYGRLARQLTPFLCLAGGMELSRLGLMRRPAAALIAVLVLAGNAAVHFSAPLRQEFPRDFLRRGDELIARQRLTDSPDHYYYRYVNVRNFVHEPEVLDVEPLETVLAAPHPFQFPPYLYETDTPEIRARRRVVDHRMRLVKVAVPPAEKIAGVDHGAVRMTVRLADGRAGFSEPLLAIGNPGQGDLFFVRYQTGGAIVLGFEGAAGALFTSEPVAVEPGRDLVISMTSPSLWPAESGDAPAADRAASASPSCRWRGSEVARVSRPVNRHDTGRETRATLADNLEMRLRAEAAVCRGVVGIAVDGRVVLDRPATDAAADPAFIYAGFNRVLSGNANSRFSGRILSVVRGGPPPLLANVGWDVGFGALDLAFVPAPKAGLTEALFVTDTPGWAIAGYIRWLPDKRVRLGLSMPDGGVLESAPLSLKLEGPNEVRFSFGSLYPPLGDPAWGGVPAARRQELKRRATVCVNGAVAINQALATPEPASPTIYFGRSPGGAASGKPLFFPGMIGRRRLDPESAATELPTMLGFGGGAGPIRLTIRFPQNPLAAAEPLVVTGRRGAGDLVYVIYDDREHIRIGWDHWGVGATISDPLKIDYDLPHTVIVQSPALAPAGDARGQPAPAQVTLDGSPVLAGPASVHPAGKNEVFIGANPIEGSTCTAAFTGSILSAERLPADRGL